MKYVFTKDCRFKQQWRKAGDEYEPTKQELASFPKLFKQVEVKESKVKTTRK